MTIDKMEADWFLPLTRSWTQRLMKIFLSLKLMAPVKVAPEWVTSCKACIQSSPEPS
jgi:hypothetical protein